MGRRRLTNKNLPIGIKLINGRFYCLPKNEQMHRVFAEKFPGKTSIALGDDPTEMRRQYVALFMSKRDSSIPSPGTVNEIIEKYELDVLPHQPAGTRNTEEQWLKGLRAEFGELRFAKSEFDAVRGDYIRGMHVQRYLEKHAKSRPVAANREVSLLRKLFRKAKGWGMTEFNPCLGVERNVETPRDTYIPDNVPLRIYEKAPPVLQCMMDIAQMFGCRPGEVRTLNEADLQEQGVLLRPLKGKRGQPQKPRLYVWTDELRMAINRAKNERAKIIKATRRASEFIFVTPAPHGTPYTKDGLVRLWTRTVERAGFDPHEYHFNDIRAKVASDMIDREEDASRQLGHTDARTTLRVYARKPTRVVPVVSITSAKKR
jgi:integrase